jgi:hypothetical protein
MKCVLYVLLWYEVLVFTQRMFVQAHTIHAFHLFHLSVWSCGIFMVWSGLPQTTPQVTTLLPLMRNKYRLTHDNSFSDHHPGTNWVFGAGVACNLTTKITSHQAWINNHAFSVYKSDKSNKTVSWCRNDFYKITTVNLLGSSVGIATELHAGQSGIESRWGWDFPPVQTGPWGPPSLLYNRYWVQYTSPHFAVKCGRGMLLTTHPLIMLWSWKSRAIPLPTLWTTLGL